MYENVMVYVVVAFVFTVSEVQTSLQQLLYIELGLNCHCDISCSAALE